MLSSSDLVCAVDAHVTSHHYAALVDAAPIFFVRQRKTSGERRGCRKQHGPLPPSDLLLFLSPLVIVLFPPSLSALCVVCRRAPMHLPAHARARAFLSHLSS